MVLAVLASDQRGPLEPLSWTRRLLARLLAPKAFSSLLEGSRGGACKAPFFFFLKGALQAPAAQQIGTGNFLST